MDITLKVDITLIILATLTGLIGAVFPRYSKGRVIVGTLAISLAGAWVGMSCFLLLWVVWA